MKDLTKKQKEVFSSIVDFINEHGYSPTVRELCEIEGLSSPATMHFHLKRLVNMGYITYVPKMSRTIRIVKGKENE